MSERLSSQPLNQQNPDQVVSFIKNLERFCNEVAENKLFWTPEVIAFFGITDETLKREYEFAREEIQRQLQSYKDGNNFAMNGSQSTQYRRQSYVNLDRALFNNNDAGGSEIVEEGVSGDSGSTKNAKKVAPQFFDPTNSNNNNRRM